MALVLWRINISSRMLCVSASPAPASFLLFLTHQKFTKSDENECSVLGPRDLLSRSLNPDAGTAKYKIRIYIHTGCLFARERARERRRITPPVNILACSPCVCWIGLRQFVGRTNIFPRFFTRYRTDLLPLGLLHAQLVARHGLNA